jgi:hypothetical protein
MKRYIGAICVMVVSWAQADIILLNDSFTDLDRSNQNLPSSASWFSGGDAADITASSGALVMSNISGGTRGALAYFTPSGSPQALAIGDSLSLSASVTIPNSSGDSGRFQFWAYDSGGSRTVSDNQSFNNSTYNGYVGYGILNDPRGNHPSRYSINERDSTANNLILGSTVLDTSTAAVTMTGITVNVSLEITRTGTDTMSLLGSINGTEITRQDVAGAITQFDTMAILSVNDSLAGTLTVDQVEVIYTAIPEPGLWSLLVSGAILLVAVRRAFPERA